MAKLKSLTLTFFQCGSLNLNPNSKNIIIDQAPNLKTNSEKIKGELWISLKDTEVFPLQNLDSRSFAPSGAEITKNLFFTIYSGFLHLYNNNSNIQN